MRGPCPDGITSTEPLGRAPRVNHRASISPQQLNQKLCSWWDPREGLWHLVWRSSPCCSQTKGHCGRHARLGGGPQAVTVTSHCGRYEADQLGIVRQIGPSGSQSVWYRGQLTSPECPTLILLWVLPLIPVTRIVLQFPQMESSSNSCPDHLTRMLWRGERCPPPWLGVCLPSQGGRQFAFGPSSR